MKPGGFRSRSNFSVNARRRTIIGIVVLATSRPFEGGVLVVVLLVVAFALRILNRQAIIPAAAIVAAGLLFNACYNERVTGHPARMPYIEYERQYAMTPAL